MTFKNLKKFLVPPVAIYGVIFLFISFLIGMKADAEAFWVYLVSLAILISGLYIATNSIKPTNTNEGLKLGMIWLIILIILDVILTVPFTGPEFFSSWHPYVSYLLAVAIPTFLSFREK